MRKISILLVIVVLMVAVMAASTAVAFPEVGKGCGCHKGQAAEPALAKAHVASMGKNANAKPFRMSDVKCEICHK